VRLIQATVPPGSLPDVQQTLDEKGIDYFSTPETGTEKYDDVLYISISEEEVEGVLEDLYASGLNAEDHVVIINTAVDIFGRTDGVAEDTGNYKRIAAAELEGKTDDLLPDERTFVTMMTLATIVATTGLLLDSSAVVVGSMVLAPLFGPAVSASVGTVIDEAELFRRGVRFQIVGVLVAVASGAVFAWVLKTTYLLPSGFALTAAPQIVQRLSPDLLSLVVAFVAGIAGVLSIATGSGRALVGVMMAAALLPPAATVGIGIAWLKPTVAVHSGVLLLVNVLAINFAGLLTLWYLGYRPQSWIKLPQTRRALLKRGGVLFAAIVVTSAFLWTYTYAGVQQTQTENALEGNLEELLGAPAYVNVTLVDVKVVQDRTALGPRTEKVIVTIGRPPGERHPDLHRNITASVHEQAGEDVSVHINVTLVVRES
jgi:uncharacterized hydrophobic protein (TIGR00341 family)